jgi:hypothetical protein
MTQNSAHRTLAHAQRRHSRVTAPNFTRLVGVFVLLIGIVGCSPMTTTTTPTPSQQSVSPVPSPANYDAMILAGKPVAYWAMTNPTGAEPDLTGNHHSGSYTKGGSLVALPNGDKAVDFDGASQYMTVPSDPSFSIPTSHQLTWEAWIRPDVLRWSRQSDPSSHGYVAWMGKCQDRSGSCEWEGRFYSSSDTRCNRLSAYVFNPSGGLGSGAYWQAVCNFFKVGQWIHVVGEYQTTTNPSKCSTPAGTISIWVNGVEWNPSYHYPGGCMSQYGVTPIAGNSPLDVGTMAMDAYFPGAVGKVAIYDTLLTQQDITSHYEAMTGKIPTGSCAESCS